MNSFAVALLVLSAATIVLLLLLIKAARQQPDLAGPLKEEFRLAREEAARSARDLREELAGSLRNTTESLTKILGDVSANQQSAMTAAIEAIQGLRQALDVRLQAFQESHDNSAQRLRAEVEASLRTTSDSLVKASAELATVQQGQLQAFGQQVEGLRASADSRLAGFQETLERSSTETRTSLETKLEASRQSFGHASTELREEISRSSKNNTDSLLKALNDMAAGQKTTLDAVAIELKGVSESVSKGLETIRASVEARLEQIQTTNAQKLEEVRRTVDEQLQGTLEKRLTESFKLVSGQLESVQRGLGEMQTLATGVGDLKKVLTNVKTRGTWGEIQVGTILEQILAPDQYAKDFVVHSDARDHVEYAVRMPGRTEDGENAVWLPIDAKFPQECYQRLQEASERGDAEGVQAALSELARIIRRCAEDIRDKYLAPPRTTDYAVLFVPTEGLYAEIHRQPGLASELLETYRVVVAGPSTLAAFLNAIRVGFKTIAIQQRVGEVWNVLGAVKTEFRKFGKVLDRVSRQLATASKTIDETGRRTRVMERKLRDVEQLPGGTAPSVLGLPESLEESEVGEVIDAAEVEGV